MRNEKEYVDRGHTKQLWPSQSIAEVTPFLGIVSQFCFQWINELPSPPKSSEKPKFSDYCRGNRSELIRLMSEAKFSKDPLQNKGPENSRKFVNCGLGLLQDTFGN